MTLFMFFRPRGCQRRLEHRDIRSSESGDTLVEILVAIVIIALTSVALMGTLTTSITSSAEYRSLATVDTVLKNFAEAVKDEVQLAPAALYSPCATTYQVVSEYPTSSVAGAGVTVFGTGLPMQDYHQDVSSISLATTTSTTTITNFVPSNSTPMVAPDGTVSATFALPSAIGAGTYNVALNVAATTIQSAIPLTVTVAAAAIPPPAAAAGYRVAISSIGWWNDATSPGSGTFDSPSASTPETQGQCLANANDDSGIQMITLQATAPNNVQDTLSMIVTNPTYSEPPGPGATFNPATDIWTPTAINVIASAPSNPPLPGQPITFTANVTGSSAVPTGTLSWDISGSPTPVSCSNPNPTISTGSSGSTSTWTCILSANEVGADTYMANVSYSGDANYGPAVGSGSLSVSPFNVTKVQLLGTPGLVAARRLHRHHLQRSYQ